MLYEVITRERALIAQEELNSRLSEQMNRAMYTLSIIAMVLKNTKPVILTKGENAGKPSKSKAVTDEAAMKDAQSRVIALLEEFKLYPELDLAFLQEQFPLDKVER